MAWADCKHRPVHEYTVQEPTRERPDWPGTGSLNSRKNWSYERGLTTIIHDGLMEN